MKFRIRYLVIIGLIISSQPLSIAQTKDDSLDYNQTYLPKGRGTSDPVYFFVDEMPTIEGGIKALRALIDQAPYPECGFRDTVQRLVVLQFVVERDGSITDLTAVRSPDVCYQRAAIFYIKQMPPWLPGKRKGEIVACLYTLPILYKFIE